MSLAPLVSCRDGSCVRVNPDLVVAVEPKSWQEPSGSPCPVACRVSLAGGEQIDVLGEAVKVQRALGLIGIQLALFRSGTPIFLNPTLVLAIEDRSDGKPLVTRSLVMINIGRFNNIAGHVLAPPFMVRETAQQILDAISAAHVALGLGRGLDACGHGDSAHFGASIRSSGAARGNGSDLSPLIGNRAGERASAGR